MTAPRRISETELHAFVDSELAPDERAEIEARSPRPAGPDWCASCAISTRPCGSAMPAGSASPAAGNAAVARLAATAPLMARGWPLAAASCRCSQPGLRVIWRADCWRSARRRAAFVTTAWARIRCMCRRCAILWRSRPMKPTSCAGWPSVSGAVLRRPSAELGWRLMGGRLLPDHGLPAAQFMYEDASGPAVDAVRAQRNRAQQHVLPFMRKTASARSIGSTGRWHMRCPDGSAGTS